ncbi:MAG: DUF2891 domain-containing protein [Alphaproteobacteria bacterium]|nr:DUF2891 domain-containing protein [Alphaproteobacteria bacterium]MBV9692871.1 DUF2891 domain-containing protein [Alphaproteobacteria bacterium]
MTTLTQTLAERFSAIALGHVRREFPNKLDHVMDGADDARGPRDLHPIFYGSFDWHSCVHGYWMLARLLRLHPGHAQADATAALFDAAFTEDNVAGEYSYLLRPSSGGFERPYGWAWALMLAAELKRFADRPWSEAFRPLENAFVARFHDYLPKLTYPLRAGTHANTAFALVLGDAYARASNDSRLSALFAKHAKRWFGADRDAPAWEPSGDDFLSPTLIEAFAMLRLLPRAQFTAWFANFLPAIGQGLPAVLFQPAMVSDRSDGKIAHLDGVNLSRAWCLRALAEAVDDPRTAALLRETAEKHIHASLPHVAGDYAGEHWLATFAVLALGPLG